MQLYVVQNNLDPVLFTYMGLHDSFYPERAQTEPLGCIGAEIPCC